MTNLRQYECVERDVILEDAVSIFVFANEEGMAMGSVDFPASAEVANAEVTPLKDSVPLTIALQQADAEATRLGLQRVLVMISDKSLWDARFGILVDGDDLVSSG